MKTDELNVALLQVINTTLALVGEALHTVRSQNAVLSELQGIHATLRQADPGPAPGGPAYATMGKNGSGVSLADVDSLFSKMTGADTPAGGEHDGWDEPDAPTT